MKKLLSIILAAVVVFSCVCMTACSDSDDVETTTKNSYTEITTKKSYSSSTGSFSNKYGTATTKCAVSGCSNYIASSGDTNCCVSHSNKCLECRKYIDGDAMYCMSCIYSAAGSGSGKSDKSSAKDCYICGDNAYSKYGSYYYCSDCLDLVKQFSY